MTKETHDLIQAQLEFFLKHPEIKDSYKKIIKLQSWLAKVSAALEIKTLREIKHEIFKN